MLSEYIQNIDLIRKNHELEIKIEKLFDSNLVSESIKEKIFSFPSYIISKEINRRLRTPTTENMKILDIILDCENLEIDASVSSLIFHDLRIYKLYHDQNILIKLLRKIGYNNVNFENFAIEQCISFGLRNLLKELLQFSNWRDTYHSRGYKWKISYDAFQFKKEFDEFITVFEF